MADALIVIALLLVAASATAAVLVRDPARQALVLGLALAVLFTVLQAPDVALSQLAVGSALRGHRPAGGTGGAGTLGRVRDPGGPGDASAGGRRTRAGGPRAHAGVRRVARVRGIALKRPLGHPFGAADISVSGTKL